MKNILPGCTTNTKYVFRRDELTIISFLSIKKAIGVVARNYFDTIGHVNLSIITDESQHNYYIRAELHQNYAPGEVNPYLGHDECIRALYEFRDQLKTHFEEEIKDYLYEQL